MRPFDLPAFLDKLALESKNDDIIFAPHAQSWRDRIHQETKTQSNKGNQL